MIELTGYCPKHKSQDKNNCILCKMENVISVIEKSEDHQVKEVVLSFISDVKKAAILLGTRGGLKGGPARAAALSAERRKEIAQKAANKRWGNKY